MLYLIHPSCLISSLVLLDCLLCKPCCPSVQTIKRKIHHCTLEHLDYLCARPVPFAVCVRFHPIEFFPGNGPALTEFELCQFFYATENKHLTQSNLFLLSNMSSSALIAAKKRFETSLKKFEIPTTTNNSEEWASQRYTLTQHTRLMHALILFYC